MVYSGLNFRKVQKRNIFSFDSALSFDSLSGSGALGFSGEGNFFNFKFIGGKVFDPEERYVFSYQENKNISISGNVSGSTYDYYINDVLFCKNGTKTNFNIENFFINTFNTSSNLQMSVSSVGANSFDILELPYFFESGIPFSGRISTDAVSGSFTVFSSQINSPSFDSGSIDKTDIPLEVNKGLNNYFTFVPNADINTENYDFDIDFFTSFGTVNKQFFISGRKPEKIYNFDLLVIDSDFDGEIFNQTKKLELIKEENLTVIQSLRIDNIPQPNLPEFISFKYHSGSTGVIDEIITGVILENGGSGYFGETLIKTLDNKSDDCDDFGKTWNKKLIDFKRNWEEIAISEDGKKIIATEGPGGVYISTTAGETWTNKTVDENPNSFFYGNSVASSSDGTKLITASYPGHVYTSSNSGETWIKRINAGHKSWCTIACSSDGLKIIASDSIYVYTSSDFGETWTIHLADRARNWFAVDISSDGTKMFAASLNDYVYISINSGETWTSKNNDTYRDWCGINCSSDGSRIIALARNSYVYLSSDFGETWKKQKRIGKHFWLGADSSSDGKKIIITDKEGYIYSTTNEGKNWRIRKNIEGNPPIDQICLSNDGRKIWAIEYGGYLYYSFNECDEVESVAGSGATFLGYPNSLGLLTGITLLNVGSGYREDAGLDFSFNATGINVLNSGSGYFSSPNFLISGKEGYSASGFLNVNSSGQITTPVFTNFGSGFFSVPEYVEVYSVLSEINIINSGSGFNDNFDLVFSGGGGSGIMASGLINFSVEKVLVTNSGRNYSSIPLVVFSGEEIQRASGVALMSEQVITGVEITNSGLYKNKPSVLFSGGDPLYQAQGQVVSVGNLTGISIVSKGNNYTGIPSVSLPVNNGSGALFTAAMSSGADIECLFSSGANGYAVKGSYSKEFKNIFNLYTGLSNYSLLNFNENGLFNKLTQSYENNIIYLGSKHENIKIKITHENSLDDYPLVGLLTISGSGNNVIQEYITGLR